MTAIDHDLISARFRRGIATYDEAARVQKGVGDCLVSGIADYPEIKFGKVLEIGCCTGSMTHTLCSRYSVNELWLNDLVPECCERAAIRVESLVGRIHALPGDIESLLLPAKLDLVVSSSTFQWLLQLKSCLAKISESLRDGGYLVFSMFGPGTMSQLKQLIEVGLCYTEATEVEDMLKENFIILKFMSYRYRIYFDTPRDVLRHVQQTGVGGAGSYRWTPGKLRKFEKQYRERFGEAQGVPLDYVSFSAVAKKRAGEINHAG